ncbi:antitoxin [Radicibacter daui]|uniref:antitoxin n=1 Tax=Radicibacter daui TaxID=3064829 RepID=UPI004046EED7
MNKVAGRPVKLFRNGRNQAVRIPREFELSGNEALMHREGDRLIIEPLPRQGLLEVLAELSPLNEDFPEIEDAPPRRVDL